MAHSPTVEVVVFVEELVDDVMSRTRGCCGPRFPKCVWGYHRSHGQLAGNLLPLAPRAGLPGDDSAHGAAPADGVATGEGVWRQCQISIQLPELPGKGRDLRAALVALGFPQDRLVILVRSGTELKDADSYTK